MRIKEIWDKTEPNEKTDLPLLRDLISHFFYNGGNEPTLVSIGWCTIDDIVQDIVDFVYTDKDKCIVGETNVNGHHFFTVINDLDNERMTIIVKTHKKKDGGTSYIVLFDVTDVNAYTNRIKELNRRVLEYERMYADSKESKKDDLFLHVSTIR